MTEIEFRSSMTVELVKHAASDNDVLHAARVSTMGEQSLDSAGAESAASRGLINYLMRARHGSPFEHATMTFLVSAPIFVFRELMRHRIASYNEESGRYRELKPVFYVPDGHRMLVQEGKPGHYVFVDGTPEQHKVVEEETKRICYFAYEAYQRMLANGIAREVARMVLPLNIYSSAYVTMNARALMNFLSLRTKSDRAAYPSYPQREIEMVAEQMEGYWTALMPLTREAFHLLGRVAP